MAVKTSLKSDLIPCLIPLNCLHSDVLVNPPGGDYGHLMSSSQTHATHADIAKRLKRANGHLLSVVAMIEGGKPCGDIAQQLHAVEKAIAQAKRILIHDHIDHCLDEALTGGGEFHRAEEFKAITKYL